ncbi:MAG TPA: carboxypeptidase-like regulatory domain-containing protein, partial [Pirellulales bacterium]|nr:carboxypeptidase-like regulatory domain-containing protein [Pirellulales bacterium]
MKHEQEVVFSDDERELDVSVTLTRRPHRKSIRGVVKDERGNPVAAARVVNYGNSADKRREATTNSAGEFSLGDPYEGYTGYQVYLAAKGFAPQRVAAEPGQDDAPGIITVTLTPGHAVRGRVVDENGKLVKGASVTPRSGQYSVIGFGETVETGEDGQFAFESLPDDARFNVAVAGYPHFAQPIALKLDGEEPVTIALDPPGLVRGRVVDRDTGNPVRQFRVQLGFSPIRKPNDKHGTYNSSWGDPGITFNSVDGKFLIKPLTSGTPLALTVLAENYERGVVDRAVAAKADEAENVTISLKPIDLSRRYTLRIQLLDHAGCPAMGAQLRLMASTKRATGPDD